MKKKKKRKQANDNDKVGNEVCLVVQNFPSD